MKTLESDIKHRELCNNANYLHRVFNQIFPSTPNLKEEELGGRLRIFSRIISSGEFDYLDHENVDYMKSCNIESRSGRKRFIDSLVNLKMIEKKNDILIPTKNGEIIWNTLLNYNNIIKGDFKIKNSISYYKYYFFRIETDGKDYCRILRNLCLENKENDVKSIVFAAGSDTPMYNNFKLLNHSDNISTYEVLDNNSHYKIFRIFFKEVVKKNEMIDFWFEYEWPGMFLNSWSTWDYSVSTDEFPTKFFCARFILNKDHNIIKNSFSLNKTDLVKESKSIGDFNNFEPLIYESYDKKEILWKMVNVPSKVKYKLCWEHR